MNARFNVLVARSLENGTVLPAFAYNGKIRVGVKVEKIMPDRTQFLGKFPNGDYRTFDLRKTISGEVEI